MLYKCGEGFRAVWRAVRPRPRPRITHPVAHVARPVGRTARRAAATGAAATGAKVAGGASFVLVCVATGALVAGYYAGPPAGNVVAPVVVAAAAPAQPYYNGADELGQGGVYGGGAYGGGAPVGFGRPALPPGFAIVPVGELPSIDLTPTPGTLVPMLPPVPVTTDTPPATTVPEPWSLALYGVGFVGLVAARRYTRPKHG